MSTNQPIGRILLKDVRLAFPNLFEPTTVNGEGKPRYSATLLMPADHAQLEEIKRKIDAIAKEKWREKATALLAGLYKTGKVALHDGDEKAQYDGFPGNFFVTAAAQENAAPTVIDRDRSPLSQRSGRPYAGCYVNASLEFWAQDNAYGKRINCTLRGIQFFKDGDSFSASRPADSDEFEEVTEGAAAEDFA
jgi:Protein of unknown function (DUF2815)